MNTAYIAIGSNIGDRQKALEDALNQIEKEGIKVTRVSSFYETPPYGYTDQPPFLNGAIEVQTTLSARELLKTLLSIEKDLGRVRQFKWGPRTIDLDIIFFNNEVYNEPDLIIPHPDMQNRSFVLTPLNDICPTYLHPQLNKTTHDLLTELNR